MHRSTRSNCYPFKCCVFSRLIKLMSSKYIRECKATEKLNLSASIIQSQNQRNDDIIKNTVGDFGRWQLKISFLMALVKFPMAWFQMSIVFLAPPTEFWCQNWGEFGNWTDDKWKELIKPPNPELMQRGLNHGYCQMIDIVNTTTTNETLMPCINGYSYAKTLFQSSITSEWDLVCDRELLIDFSQISLMLGVLLGNIIFGVLADKKGRKRILMLCVILQSVLGLLASMSPFLWLFILLRFFLALANGGTMVTSFVICMEVVGGKWRTIVPILYQIPFGFGYALMSGFAYFLREWRTFHLVLSLLSSFYILLTWLIPESPRWLLAIGKKEEAILILRTAAKENKLDLSEIDHAMTDLSNNSYPNEQNNISFKALFSTRKLTIRSSLLSANWAIAGVTFYAFTQYLGHIGENLFLTVALGGLVSLPGTIICVFLVSNYGRRYTIAFSHLITSACFLLILAFPKGLYAFDWPRIVFAGIGVIGISVSIPAMYLFTGELFPTILRNSGVGFVIMFCRLASMFAPLIISLHNVADFLPLSILGIAAFVQAILVLPLPETRGIILPDTIEDLELRNNHKFLEEKRTVNQDSFEDL